MPHLIDVLDDESRRHFDEVSRGARMHSVSCTPPTTGWCAGSTTTPRTAFEVHDPSLGAQSALGGGGRYDGLIEELGCPPTPGVGFSIGLDRTLLAMEERGEPALERPGLVYVVAMEGTRTAVPTIARALRMVYTVDYDLEARSLNAQMKAADRAGARLVMLLGEDEWKRGEVVLKDLVSGNQGHAAPRGDGREDRPDSGNGTGRQERMTDPQVSAIPGAPPPRPCPRGAGAELASQPHLRRADAPRHQSPGHPHGLGAPRARPRRGDLRGPARPLQRGKAQFN